MSAHYDTDPDTIARLVADLNARLRQDYVEDCAKGLARWNRVIEKAGVDFVLRLPHRAFNRRIDDGVPAHAKLIDVLQHNDAGLHRNAE